MERLESGRRKTWYNYQYGVGMAGDCVSDMGMRAAPAEKSKMSLPELFPTPRKISETGNSFILPQELRFFCSDQSLSEGITPWSEKTSS